MNGLSGWMDGIPDQSPKTEGNRDFSSDPCEKEIGSKEYQKEVVSKPSFAIKY